MASKVILVSTFLSITGVTAHGELQLTYTELVDSVVVEVSGSLNTSGFTFYNTMPDPYPPVGANLNVETEYGVTSVSFHPFTGLQKASFDRSAVVDFSGFTIPAFINSNTSSAVGDLLRIVSYDIDEFAIRLERDYVSGNPLSISAVFPGASLASMGLIEGSYTWIDYGDDQIKLDVISAVPEPSSYGVYFGGILLTGVILRRMKKAKSKC